MFKGTLRPFQEEAREEMVDRGSMLLAFYMGLGKTPTTIATIETLIEEGEVDRCLVVVPASLKFQWLREIGKFTDSRAVVIDGPKAHRTNAWKHARSRCRYVIVNPETLVNDQDELKVFDYQAMVIDEATMIKSPGAIRSKKLKRYGRRAAYRYALTGQPIENRPEELFSIMEFVDPDVLGDPEVFDKTFVVRNGYGKPLRYRNLPTLHKVMKEAMVRKTRSDVADQLPAIITQVVPVDFDPKGAELYRYIARDLQAKLAEVVGRTKGFDLLAHYNGEGGDKQAQGQIMARLTCLRMLCDNPELLRFSASLNEEAEAIGAAAGSVYARQLQQMGKLEGLKASPKLAACVEMIEEVLAEDPRNKVVLFSFFKENLRIIQRATAHLTRSVLFMGGMNAQERDKAKQQFGLDPSCRLFLSSDAGGYGVDLPMANYLISYDLPWSAGKFDQREARIVRLSSEWPEITLVSFVMADSVEEYQHGVLMQKRGISAAIMDGKSDARGNFELSLSSLSEFLATHHV